VFRSTDGGDNWSPANTGLSPTYGGAFAVQVRAAAEQIAGLAHALGVGVGEREGAAAEQPGDLAGVDLVILGFAAVAGLQVQVDEDRDLERGADASREGAEPLREALEKQAAHHTRDRSIEVTGGYCHDDSSLRASTAEHERFATSDPD